MLWKLPFFYDYSKEPFNRLKQEEINFWDMHLEIGKRELWMEELINPQTRKKHFPGLLLPHIERIRRIRGEVSILDVGSGPLSPLVWGVEQKLFTLAAIDPLAEEYLTMLEKYNISYPVKPIKCTGENLSNFFPGESFDIVYSRNALDHTISVNKCIENIYRALKKEGIFLLEGFIKEGTNRNWTGLHQHDLIPMNGELFCCDKRGKSIKVASGFSCIYQEQSGRQPGDWYKIIFQK